MTEKYQPIPHRLKNMAVGGHVAGAVDIYDDRLFKNQQDINENTYRKDETYSKEQLNNMITTPEQEYLSVTATDATTTLSDIATLIATKYPDGKESADTVYRVGCWDGEQYDTGVYTEYVWDGTQYIPVGVKNPGIDDTPTLSSSNLVKSSGVYEKTSIIDYHLINTDNIFTDKDQEQGILNDSGEVIPSTSYPDMRTTNYLPVEPLTDYYIGIKTGASRSVQVVAFYGDSGYISREIQVTSFTTPLGCTKIRLTSRAGAAGFDDGLEVSKDGIVPYNNNKQLYDVNTGLEEKINLLSLSVFGKNSVSDFVVKDTVINASNVWQNVPGTGVLMIPVKELVSFRIKNGNGYPIVFAFLKSNKIKMSLAPDFVYKYEFVEDPITGEITQELVTDGQGNPVVDSRRSVRQKEDYTSIIPPDTKYLYIVIMVTSSGSSIENFPSALEVDGITFIKEQETKEDVEWNTVFFDDFNTDLDTDVWYLHTQGRTTGGRYNSRFVTTNNNAFTKDGCLCLTCTKDATEEEDGTYNKSDNTEAPIEYRASYISTCDRFALEEGQISAKMKTNMPIEEGMFPVCFWTFGQNAPWGTAFEADIAETASSIRTTEATASDGTVIYAGSVLNIFGTGLYTRNSEDAVDGRRSNNVINYAIYHDGEFVENKDFVNKIDVTKWHIYTLRWNKETLTFLVDNVPYRTYDAGTIDSVNEDGETGFFHPQDIRFNIKAAEKSSVENPYLFVDWVKAEAPDLTPCISIYHDDVELSVDEGIYIEPEFNEGCSNRAFTIEIKDTSIVRHAKFNNDASQQVIHRLVGVAQGSTDVTIYSADGSESCTFSVTVS